MKAFTVVLLIAALCMGTVSSLICYRCENVYSHRECTESVKCSDMDRVCMTLKNQPPGLGTLISKWCAPECPNSNVNITFDCCSTDYCNSGGPSSVKTSYTVVITATLASFFYIFRMGL